MESVPNPRPPQILTCAERRAFRDRDRGSDLYAALAWRLGWAVPFQHLTPVQQLSYIEVAAEFCDIHEQEQD